MAYYHYDINNICVVNSIAGLPLVIFLFDEERLEFYVELSDLYFVLVLFPDYQAANGCDIEHVAYEFFTQAFVLYEEEIAVIVLLRSAIVEVCYAFLICVEFHECLLIIGL